MAKTTTFIGGSGLFPFAWSSSSNWTNGIPTNGDTVIVNPAESAESLDNIPSLSLANLTLPSTTVAIVENGTLTINSLIGDPGSQLWVSPLVGGVPTTSPSTAIINSIITPGQPASQRFFINAFGSATVVDNASSDPGVVFDIGNGATVVVAGNGAGSASQFDFTTYKPNFGIQHNGGIATVEFENPTPGSLAELFSLGAGDIIELPGTAASVSLGGSDLKISTNIGTYSFSYSKDPSTSVLGYTTHFDSTTGLEAIELNCFLRGTRLATMHGETAIEDLSVGDLLATRQGDETLFKPIKWIGRRRIGLTTHSQPAIAAPIRIEREAFAPNLPHRDLLVSPDHAIFVDGKLICAGQLVNGTTIRPEVSRRKVEYFHVELDQHAIILAEGLPAESYLDTGNRGFFSNSTVPRMLHPDLTDAKDFPTRQAASCQPFVTDEDNVRPVWERLAARAAILGRSIPNLVTTSKSDLHLMIDGRPVQSIAEQAGRFTFIVPRETGNVSLASRAGAPRDARPWLGDRRCLGIAVARIVLRAGDEVYDMPLDHPGLAKGWWAVEREGVAMHRWTNGDAILPLPRFSGPATLEITLGGEMLYVTAVEPTVETHSKAA